MAKESTSVSDLKNDRWGQFELGVSLLQDLGSVTSFDVDYLCNYVYPFIQLVNSDAVFSAETEINFVTASTGWVIHDYGEAISASAPRHIKPSSIIMSQIDTAAEIADLIATKNWTTVELIAGSPLMERLLWIEARRFGFELTEYTPSEDDEKCYERLFQHAKERGITWEKVGTKKPLPPEDLSLTSAWGGEEISKPEKPEEKTSSETEK